jgi:nicotinate dehydrogenase subunit B
MAVRTQIEINGSQRELAADPERSLLSVLRDDLLLTGCKYGCGEGECGACTVLNPDHLQNQIEGAVVQGLGGALFEAIDFDRGQIKNAAFSAYRVPRFSDTPHLETVLVERLDLAPIGAGETPIIAIAPAVAAAIHQATGIRPRSLPISASGVKT